MLTDKVQDPQDCYDCTQNPDRYSDRSFVLLFAPIVVNAEPRNYGHYRKKRRANHAKHVLQLWVRPLDNGGVNSNCPKKRKAANLEPLLPNGQFQPHLLSIRSRCCGHFFEMQRSSSQPVEHGEIDGL